MEFDISYTNKEITPWGGMVFLKQMMQKIGFNPDYAIEDVMRSENTIKIRFHGSFLDEVIVNYFEFKKLSKALFLK